MMRAVVLFLFLQAALTVLAGAAEQDRRETLYPDAPVSTVASGKWVRPRASCRGTVTLVRHETDGDWHFRLEDGDSFIVCEEIPELRMPNGQPKVGDKVRVRGVVRYDGKHKWWELHPVTSWEKE